MIPPAVQVLALPIGIVAIASYRVADKLEGAVQAFLAMTFQEQLSLLGLLFGVVFAAVSVSHVQILQIGSGAATRAKADYPLLEIAQASTDLDKFNCLYPALRDEITQHMRSNEMPSSAVSWCEQMMDYNVPGGKLNRGTTVVAVLRALMRGRELSPLQVARASVLGWSIEFLQAFFLVADDVMDDSQTRRGQPCWYKNPAVKLIAINDSFLLESFVFTILKQHFGSEKCFPTLVGLMLDVIQKTEFGQLLDLTTASGGSTGKTADQLLDSFTMDQYRLIVRYKTAYYSFYLPVALGMVLGGVTDTGAFDAAKRICLAMGEYFQVQDDYLDCFGDPAVIGKVGTDIQDNKCSWLVVTALTRCDAKQRKALRDNYGQWNDAKVQKVKQLYRDLDLPGEFERYEEESYRQIQAELDRLKKVPRAVFEVLLKKIYKRSM
jgi:farnesyl diphosphate synthase